jgi:hypothetical protein
MEGGLYKVEWDWDLAKEILRKLTLTYKRLIWLEVHYL